MVKSPVFAHASPKKTIALGSGFGDTPTVSSSSVCSSSHDDQSEGQGLNVVDEE